MCGEVRVFFCNYIIILTIVVKRPSRDSLLFLLHAGLGYYADLSHKKKKKCKILDD